VKIRAGFEMIYDFPQATRLIAISARTSRWRPTLSCLITSPTTLPFGRVLIAQGRGAADVPITQTFGRNTLVGFKVRTDELVETSGAATSDQSAQD
jgi:hypothetical protein